MSVRRWAWLIGMTDEADAQLRDRAKSFAAPPDLDLVGARPDFAGYVIERRAIRLEATAHDVKITIKPKTPCVNPVFEFAHAPRGSDHSQRGRRAARMPETLPGTVDHSGSIARSANAQLLEIRLRCTACR